MQIPSNEWKPAACSALRWLAKWDMQHCIYGMHLARDSIDSISTNIYMYRRIPYRSQGSCA